MSGNSPGPETAPARPHVTLNAAMSLDGKIATAARGKVRFSSARDRKLMDELRAASDALLVGAGTLRAEDPPMQVRDPALREERARSGRDERLVNVVLSASLNLPLSGRFFTTPGVRRIVFTVEEAREDLAARISGRAEVIRIGRGAVPVRELLEALAQRGVGRLLVEGGGEVNAAFLEAGAVDEIFLTVAPVVIGGRGSPTPSEGEGFLPAAFPRFDLVSCRSESNEVFLHYLRPGAPVRPPR